VADSFKYYCPLCVTVKRENRVTVCKGCADKFIACRNVYHRAVRGFKALRRLSMPEVFEKLLTKVEGMKR
jgi:hypothetical protein